MTVTIRDIAKDAAVSIATVSRLVNGSGYVGKATAERISEAIDRLGFRPNAIGRSLSTARTHTLGVVVPTLSNPVFADAVSGITESAREAGYNIMISATDYGQTDEAEAAATLLDSRVDAMVLTVRDPNASPALDMLERAGIPYRLIFNQPGVTNRPSVTVDNHSAGRAVATHFAALGHYRLAMISGGFAASDRAVARRNGFLAGAASAALLPPPVREVDFVALDVDAALRTLFETPASGPTGIFCSNDLLAISVIGGLERLGLKVPADVSVIGFDGITIGTHLHPTLATVVQPSREMGATAARLLLRCLDGHDDADPAVLPFTLRPGESAGPAGQLCPAELQNPTNHSEGNSQNDR